MSAALPLNHKPRVLVLSASSGAGPVRAAQALEKAFLAHGDCSVEHIDALTCVSKVFQQPPTNRGSTRDRGWHWTG
jgi:hypothetical protein